MIEVANAPHDIVIRNGKVYDGLGNAPKQADVAISGGKVTEIAPRIDGQAAQEVDATGKWVTPGFLDIHTHYDAEIEAMPGLEESIRHGVTTVIMGNCSLSAAMGSEEDLLDIFCRVENLPKELLAEWLGGKISWRTLAEYYDHLESLPMGPNVASFLGHSNLRFSVMGLERSLTCHKPTDEELGKMKKHVHEAVDAGYLGLSIDLLPWHRMANEPHKGISIPSQQARPAEYRALANVLRERDAVLQATPNALQKQTIMLLFELSAGRFRKPLRTTIVAALDAKTNRKVHRLATVGATLVNTVLGGNLRFQALAEPFLMFGDGPIIPFFEELPSGSRLITATEAERRALLRDKSFREDFRKDWLADDEKLFHCNLDDMKIVACPDGSIVGKTFGEVARDRKVDAVECLLDLLAEHDVAIRWASEAANDRPTARKYLLGHKYTLPGFNDSGAHNRNMAFQDGALQMLRQAVEDPNWISIERAVQRLTSEPAEWLGLKGVGTIARGQQADIAVIDPSKLTSNLGAPVEHTDDRIGHMRVVKRSDGVVSQVVVNGKMAYTDGAFADTLGKEKYGKLLRRK